MAVRRRWPGNLVAITGSMGKTTTRTFVAQVLQSAFAVYQTPGNYNNLFGLPLALFGLRLQHDFGIFEMGMSAPGEIAEMCRIAAPTVGILTNVAPVHLAFFNSVEEIAQAKEELAEALPPYGTLIYNADDPARTGYRRPLRRPQNILRLFRSCGCPRGSCRDRRSGGNPV